MYCMCPSWDSERKWVMAMRGIEGRSWKEMSVRTQRASISPEDTHKRAQGPTWDITHSDQFSEQYDANVVDMCGGGCLESAWDCACVCVLLWDWVLISCGVKWMSMRIRSILPLTFYFFSLFYQHIHRPNFKHFKRAETTSWWTWKWYIHAMVAYKAPLLF